jgi:hypothetical protein
MQHAINTRFLAFIARRTLAPIRMLSVAILLAVALARVDTATNAPASPRYAYESGKVEAKEDLRRNILKLRTYGSPMDGYDRYEATLRSQYRIETEWVEGCEPSEEVMENARGYNEVMTAEIERRYGKSVLARVRAAAVRPVYPTLPVDIR